MRTAHTRRNTINFAFSDDDGDDDDDDDDDDATATTCTNNRSMMTNRTDMHWNTARGGQHTHTHTHMHTCTRRGNTIKQRLPRFGKLKEDYVTQLHFPT